MRISHIHTPDKTSVFISPLPVSDSSNFQPAKILIGNKLSTIYLFVFKYFLAEDRLKHIRENL